MNPFADIRVVQLSGEDFQRDERLRDILAQTVDPATRDFNLDTLWCLRSSSDPNDFSLEKLSDMVMAFPMMAERRVVVVRFFDQLHKETQKKAAAILAGVPETTLAIVEGEKASLVPKPKTGFLAESFKPVYEKDLPPWIKARFRKRGKTVADRAAALLMNNVGMELAELDREIEKVAMVAGDRAAITEEDVRAVVGEYRRDTVYAFCNAVGLGRFGEAAGVLENLMENEKNKETFYLSSLFAHILKIAACNSRVRGGMPPEEAQKAVTTSPFLWKLNHYAEQSRNFTPEAARNALLMIGRSESLLKKSALDNRLILELMLPFAMPVRKRAAR